MQELRLEASHTHLYPGSRGTVFGALPATGEDKGRTCQVAFSDGAMALGTLVVRSDSEAVLATDPHTTAAGTQIPTKRWRMEIARDADGARRFRVRASI